MSDGGFGVVPGSPEDLAGRRREEESDELEVFERRREWFQQYHTDRSGSASDLLVAQAVEHAVQLEALPPVQTLDPGGDAPAEPTTLTGDVETPQVAGNVTLADNAAPQSSLGFVGQPVAVEFDEEQLPEGLDIKLPLTPETAQHVDVRTIRMFRFDDDAGSWVLVHRSGVAGDQSYAWARAHRPGQYVPIGLPREGPLLRAVATLRVVEPHVEAARRLDATATAVDAVRNLLFAGGQLRSVSADLPEALHDFGGFEVGARPSVDVDEFATRLSALDLIDGRLPEWEILDDQARGPQTEAVPAPEAAPLIVLPPMWGPVGPDNVNGRIKSVAVHPGNVNIVWAGAANGGVWKTIDGGASWTPLWSQELSLAVGFIAVSSSNASVLYAATGEDTPGWNPSWPGVGVYKSTNGGSAWTLVGAIASTRCTRVLIHPTNPDVVYVAGSAGLHKSTNGGVSWTNVRTDHVSDALLDPNNANRLFVGVHNKGVFRSLDAGATWTGPLAGLPSGAAAEWIKLAMGKNGSGGTNFLLAKMGTNSGSVYKSTNGGTSWSLLASNVQPATYNEWTNMIAVDPNNHNNIIAGGVGVSRSTNGTTFAAVGGTHSDHHQVVFSPTSPTTLYMATDGGVYRSINGGQSWTLVSFKLRAAQLYSIGVSQSAAFRLGSGTQDQGIIQTVAPLNWVDTNAGNEGGFFVVDPNNEQVIYVTPWSDNLRRSTNGGASWTTIAPAATVNDLAVRPGNSNHLLCVAGSAVLHSTNQGTNWSPAATLGGGALRVAYSPSNSSICYAATSSGRVYRSTSAGTNGTWSEPYTVANKPPNGVIAAVAVAANNPNRLFIGYAGFGVAHVWRSVDGGAHWTVAAGSGVATLPDIPVNALVVHHLNSDVVYAATDIGVFRTADGGTTWGAFSFGLPRAFVSGLALRKTSKTLYASTMGRGAFRFNVSSP